MVTIKIGFQILNVDPEDIIKIQFYWEAGLNSNTDYWIDFHLRTGYKWSFFIGNIKEIAQQLYQQTIDKIFNDITIIAQ